MKPYNKQKETVVLQAQGVDADRFVVQFAKKAPHIRMYERKQRGSIVINKKVGQFYKMRKAVQRAWSLSQESKDV